MNLWKWVNKRAPHQNTQSIFRQAYWANSSFISFPVNRPSIKQDFTCTIRKDFMPGIMLDFDADKFLIRRTLSVFRAEFAIRIKRCIDFSWYHIINYQRLCDCNWYFWKHGIWDHAKSKVLPLSPPTLFPAVKINLSWEQSALDSWSCSEMHRAQFHQK